MIRLIPLAFIALALCGCTAEEKALYKAALTGEYKPTEAELSQYSAILAEAGEEVSELPSSVEPVAYVEPGIVVEPSSVEPPPPDCSPWLWRGTWYDGCTGQIVGYVE